MKGYSEKDLTFAQSVAKEAGEIMRRYFDGDQQREIKDDGTPLTIADTSVNSMVLERVRAAYPDDGVIGEEESSVEYGTPGRVWICDPIDGTKAFTWGVPTAMFSLALMIDNVPVVGVGYEPVTDKMYWAVSGGGAFCNGNRITVNDVSLESGILGTTSSYSNMSTKRAYFDELVRRKVQLAAFSGAVAKCMRVAEGRFVGYEESYVNPYDVAASHVIVEEAGGKITAPDGAPLDYSKPFRGAIVSNGVVHDELIGLVNGYTR